MSRPTVTDRGAWSRTAHLLAAILLLGGIVGGPLAHLTHEASEAHAAACDGATQEHPAPAPVPDHHHDCPTCITLTGAVAPVLDPAPALPVGDGAPLVEAGPAFHDRLVLERSRARAPPHA